MKPTLVFVEDDASERESLRQIVEREYEFVAIPWPLGRPIEGVIQERLGGSPEIIVLDLYLPPGDGSAPEDIATGELARQQVLLRRITNDLTRLYPNYRSKPKDLLRDTVACLLGVRGVLDAQWLALGQSPDHGIALMQHLRARHPKAPVVFYSRKITPEDVIRVLQAGAADAIRKDALMPEEIRARLRRVREIYTSSNARELHARRLNVNITLSPPLAREETRRVPEPKP